MKGEGLLPIGVIGYWMYNKITFSVETIGVFIEDIKIRVNMEVVDIDKKRDVWETDKFTTD